MFITSVTKIVVKLKDQPILCLSQLETNSQISANQWKHANILPDTILVKYTILKYREICRIPFPFHAS